MRNNVERFIGAAVLGVGFIVGYELIKTGVQVIKDKRATKGIKDQMENLDQLIKQAEDVELQAEEIL